MPRSIIACRWNIRYPRYDFPHFPHGYYDMSPLVFSIVSSYCWAVGLRIHDVCCFCQSFAFLCFVAAVAVSARITIASDERRRQRTLQSLEHGHSRPIHKSHEYDPPSKNIHYGWREPNDASRRPQIVPSKYTECKNRSDTSQQSCRIG